MTVDDVGRSWVAAPAQVASGRMTDEVKKVMTTPKADHR